jgi:DNA-binding NarL/FixJ family response regulator
MPGKISLVIASPEFLFRKGMDSFISEQFDLEVVDFVSTASDLLASLALHTPQVLITDCWKFPEGTPLLRQLKKASPDTAILLISDPAYATDISLALDMGATSILLKECEAPEILEAIQHTAQHKRFLCGKILERLTFQKSDVITQEEGSCAGLNITEREIEIIRHVAEGLSNKEIAEKLFLSTHTVNTHRKNIMNKLQVNNTAGLVLFAVRNEIIGPNKYLFS